MQQFCYMLVFLIYSYFNIESQRSVLHMSQTVICSWFLSVHAELDYSLICNHSSFIGDMLKPPFHSPLSEPSSQLIHAYPDNIKMSARWAHFVGNLSVFCHHSKHRGLNSAKIVKKKIIIIFLWPQLFSSIILLYARR